MGQDGTPQGIFFVRAFAVIMALGVPFRMAAAVRS